VTVRALVLGPRTGLGVLAILCTVLCGCNRAQSNIGEPSIEFISVPLAGPGDPNKLTVISGRVAGAEPGQQIVLYARSQQTWWVQPFANQPFTKIQADSTFRSATHPGEEYAALLVGPRFRVITTARFLPAEGIIASAVTKGKPPAWRRWWALTAYGFACLFAVFAFHRFRLKQMRNELNARFEERLAERTRVAQILHDTLLQGVIGASMQLNLAVDQLPSDSPALQPLRRVLQSMGQVVEEGGTTLRGLSSPREEIHELEQFFCRIPEELNVEGDVDIRVTVEGPVLPLKSSIHAGLQNFGHDALVEAFRQRGARNAEVELRYTASEVRLLVRDDGLAHSSDSGSDGYSMLSGMRAQAEGMGARLKLRRRRSGENDIEARLPIHVACESRPSGRAPGWLRRLFR
jgi:signal transduction histidine kinase